MELKALIISDYRAGFSGVLAALSSDLRVDFGGSLSVKFAFRGVGEDSENLAECDYLIILNKIENAKVARVKIASGGGHYIKAKRVLALQQEPFIPPSRRYGLPFKNEWAALKSTYEFCDVVFAFNERLFCDERGILREKMPPFRLSESVNLGGENLGGENLCGGAKNIAANPLRANLGGASSKVANLVGVSGANLGDIFGANPANLLGGSPQTGANPHRETQDSPGTSPILSRKLAPPNLAPPPVSPILPPVLATRPALRYKNTLLVKYPPLMYFCFGDVDFPTLCAMTPPPKPREISCIAGFDKRAFAGHMDRIRFVRFLQRSSLGAKIDFFGSKTAHELAQKKDGILPYKYSIAIENNAQSDYFSEKIADVFLGFAMPIYFGAPNLADYFPRESFISIDINKPREALEIIQNALDSGAYERNFWAILEARRRCLEDYSMLFGLARLVANDFAAHGESEPRILGLKPYKRALRFTLWRWFFLVWFGILRVLTNGEGKRKIRDFEV